MRILILISILLITNIVIGQVHVSGYTKKNGTYVAPYMRSSPNSSPYDNYSYPGNTNPYTGKIATGDPDTYIKNLYKNRNNAYNTGIGLNSYGENNAIFDNSHLPGLPEENHYNNYSKSYFVKSTTLNVRKGMSTNYGVITTLYYGEPVEVVSEENSKWAKVRISYFEGDEYKTRLGYVYKDYISSADQMFSNVNNTPFITPEEALTNSLGKNDISVPVKDNDYTTNYNASSSNHPYGVNKGSITIWTDCPNDGQITVKIDGVYKGKISSYFDNLPNCGAAGTVSVKIAQGNHKVSASGNKKIWEGYVTITADECRQFQLSK